MKKRKLNKLNISNRLSYTLITIILLSVIIVGVYALAPGVKPNPGHLITEIAPPAGCSSGQVLSWNGTAWNCIKSGGNFYYRTNICSTTSSGACRAYCDDTNDLVVGGGGYIGAGTSQALKACMPYDFSDSKDYYYCYTNVYDNGTLTVTAVCLTK